MRGTRLEAWRNPPVLNSIESGGTAAPVNSQVIAAQQTLDHSIHRTLAAIARDVQQGLSETVGINAVLNIADRASVRLELPRFDNANLAVDNAFLARAIDMENVEAWCDEANQIHVAIHPFYSTKDVDQTVLAITKVIHVRLGIHATDNQPAPNFIQRLMSAALAIATIQRNLKTARPTTSLPATGSADIPVRRERESETK